MEPFVAPTITDLLKARRFLQGRVRHTPTELSLPLSDLVGTPVFVKWENRQICVSFKLRGALNKMYSLSAAERGRGVVTASSGNHGQGVAMAAALLELKALVCVPGSCPETKQAAIRRLGGDWVELRVVGHLYDDAEREAHDAAEREGKTYISSFEDRHVVAGAGTLGLELLCDEPEIDVIVTPAGGGGLMNGIAIAARTLRPSVEIWGVQSVASPPGVLSGPGGTVVETTYDDSLADGLTGSIPQSLLTLAKERVAGILAVTEEEIAEAIAFCHRAHHQVVEGAGAVGVAALMKGRVDVAGRRVAVVISGGNIDERPLLDVLNRYA